MQTLDQMNETQFHAMMQKGLDDAKNEKGMDINSAFNAVRVPENPQTFREETKKILAE